MIISLAMKTYNAFRKQYMDLGVTISSNLSEDSRIMRIVLRLIEYWVS